MAIKAKIATQPTIKVDVGVKGKQGKDGVTFYPNVSENGDLSWTNDGGLKNPPIVNIKGDQGDPGNDYVLTDNDKTEIAETAAESVAEDYAIRKTVYIRSNGYCIERESGLESPFFHIVESNQNDLYKIMLGYKFVYVDDFYLEDADSVDLNTKISGDANELIFEGFNAHTGIVIRGYWGADFNEDSVIDFTYYRNVASEKQYGTMMVGEGLKSNEGVVSVDKNALLGDIGNKTMKEYTDTKIETLKSTPELIETITVEEDGVVEIKRTTDPNGTPYNLSSMEIFINQKAGVNNGRGGLVLGIKETADATTKNSPLISPVEQVFASASDTSAMFRVRINHGNLYAETTARKSTTASYTPTDLNIPSFAVENSEKAVSIHGFKYYSLNNYAIPVGTTIEVWGERNA